MGKSGHGKSLTQRGKAAKKKTKQWASSLCVSYSSKLDAGRLFPYRELPNKWKPRGWESSGAAYLMESKADSNSLFFVKILSLMDTLNKSRRAACA
jgi:hypothetical protein